MLNLLLHNLDLPREEIRRWQLSGRMANYISCFRRPGQFSPVYLKTKIAVSPVTYSLVITFFDLEKPIGEYDLINFDALAVLKENADEWVQAKLEEEAGEDVGGRVQEYEKLESVLNANLEFAFAWMIEEISSIYLPYVQVNTCQRRHVKGEPHKTDAHRDLEPQEAVLLKPYLVKLFECIR